MRKASAKSVLYVAGLAAALIYLAYSVTSTRPPRTGAGRKPATTETAATGRREAVELVQAAPSEADFSRYQMIVDRDIFSAPKPPPPPLPPISISKPYVFRPGDDKPTPSAPPTPPSLANWSYVGYVTIDGVMTGLLQNDETNRSVKELKVREQFQGYRVESITREEMVLSFSGTRVSLTKPLDFPIVPLEGIQAAAQAGRPQRPGARGGGPPERPGG